MINIIFLAMHFSFALIISMLILGYIDRRSERPLKTKDILLLLAIPWVAMQIIGFAIRSDFIPVKLQAISMLVYLIFPFLLLIGKFKKTKSEGVLYSFVILISAFFSGAALTFFFQRIS